MNPTSILGVVIGLAAVLGGIYFEGGSVASILQPTAAFIVFAGTAGATMLSFPLRDITAALASLRVIFSEERRDPSGFIDEFERFSKIARKHGLVALEAEISRVDDLFLKKGLRLVSDAAHSRLLRETLEQENITYEAEKSRAAKVFETAGGFSPTIGIIGAVLGLIRVMENLSDPSKLGSGIAVAFVATIYGVGLANLLLLPISKKLINGLKYELAIREMIIEGVIGIQSGLNPYYLRERLKVFIDERQVPDSKEAKNRGR